MTVTSTGVTEPGRVRTEPSRLPPAPVPHWLVMRSALEEEDSGLGAPLPSAAARVAGSRADGSAEGVTARVSD